MDDILSKFKNKFIEEAQSLINSLEEDLLILEQTPDDKDIIDEIFRVMHTMKGISGMYGFDKIAEYTHKLEAIYDLIRENKLKVDKRLIDITLESADHIKNLLIDEHFANLFNKKKHLELNERIDLFIELSTNFPTHPFEKNNLQNKTATTISEIKKQPEENTKTYYILFKPDESLFKRAINIAGIFQDLSQLGTYKLFKHNFATRAEIEDNNWGIILVSSADMNDIEDVFIFVDDHCKIVKISDSDVFFKESLLKENSEEELNVLFNETLNEEDIIKSFYTELNEEKVQTIEEKPEIETKIETKIETSILSKNISVDEIEHAGAKSFFTTDKVLAHRISVDSEKLDVLMNLVSELVTTNAQLTVANKTNHKIHLDNAVEKIEKLSKLFRENALSLRLIPINDIIVRFHRLIRDLSHSLNKEIKFVTQGTDTELDKNIIDSLVEPIMHLIRNCIDHGIETPETRLKNGKSREGLLKFSASYSGTNIIIRIEDDGRGIDEIRIHQKAVEKNLIEPDQKLTKKELYDLIFLPGFSTAESLTNVSGRGVGMDVVKRKIEEARGTVSVESEIDKGTAFIITLQQTVSIIDALLIQSENTHFLVPVNEILICGQQTHYEIFKTQNKQIEFNQELIPFIHLRTEFELEGTIPKNEKIIIISKNDSKIAIVADRIVGEHQAVLKPLGTFFKKQDFLLGASVMGDGNMALMLDTAKLTENIFEE